jgi:hypothetical protein
MPLVDRRGFLVRGSAAVAAGLVTTGCSGDAGPAPATTAPPPDPADPDEAVRAGVAASEAELIAAYREVLAADPELGAVLRPLLAHHEAHLQRVAATPAGATPSAAASVPASPAASPPPGAEGTPEDRPAAAPARLRDLADLERRAVRQRTRACNGSTDPGLARALCLIAASEAQHADVLMRAARRAGRASP